MNKRIIKKIEIWFLVLMVFWGMSGLVLPSFATDDNLKLDRRIGSEEIKKSVKEEGASRSSVNGSSPKRSTIEQSHDLEYVSGEILVKFDERKIDIKQPFGRAKAEQFVVDKKIEKKRENRENNIFILKLKEGESIDKIIEMLENDSDVEYAQPNYIYRLSSIDTNDTHKDLLWGLDNEDDRDIDIPEAWEISEGGENEIVVAVIDTGVAYNHPDLTVNMWHGGDCVDGSGNFLGDCNYGYDYEDGDRDPLPTTSSHGTHIAGTIGAVKNNEKGIIGVAPNVRIMALKVHLTTSQILMAINFAEYNEAKIINASWGGNHFDEALYNSINNFSGLFVAAAGNDNSNNETAHFYPSDYDLDNIISVAATDRNDNLASFSNYGDVSVDVGAPGVNIYSTIADLIVFSEDFEGVSFDVETGGETESYWGVGHDGYSEVVYSDIANYPYESKAYTWLIQSGTSDLSGSDVNGATLNFTIWCDTPSSPNFKDYIRTFYYSNSVGYNARKYDEDKIYLDGGIAWIDDGHLGYYRRYTEDISNYLTNDFRFGFDWITNSSVDFNYGCTIDDITIAKYTDGSDENYGYYSGTSMATPHVVGLAALIWGYRSDLSYLEVKEVILNTGDDLISLDGKTVTGKRINAFNALSSLVSIHTISGTLNYFDGIKFIPDATVILEDEAGAPVGSTVSAVDGYYEFTDIPGGEDYVIRVEKEDSSIGVTGADITMIAKHIVGIEYFTSTFQTIASDVNRNEFVTGSDITMIAQYIVGLIDELLSGDWKFYSSDAALTEENYTSEGMERTYTNLAEDMTEQDFTGVKMGDVNNSWEN